MSQKSRITAALFGFFLGQVGVHSFYLGFKLKGFLHIALFATGQVFCIIPYVGWALGGSMLLGNFIWQLVEAIMLVSNRNSKDARGNLLI